MDDKVCPFNGLSAHLPLLYEVQRPEQHDHVEGEVVADHGGGQQFEADGDQITVSQTGNRDASQKPNAMASRSLAEFTMLSP